MDNNFNNDNVVGVDPTFMQTVESLDVLPPSANTGKPKDTKNPSTGKKILFAILIIALMAGVAYGVYYFLNLGKTKPSGVNVVLKDIKVLLNSELSEDISDYGQFQGVSASSCTINLLQVNTSEKGEYPYTVTCGNQTFSAFVSVVESTKLPIATKIVSVSSVDDIKASDFFESEDESIKYEITGGLDKIISFGGPFIIELSAQTDDIVENVMGIVIVNENPSFALNCKKDDRMVYYTFENTERKMNDVKLYIDKIHYEKEEDYNSGLETLKDTMHLIDNKNLDVYTVSTFTDEEFSKEINSEYSGEIVSLYKDIRNYYKSNGYEC